MLEPEDFQISCLPGASPQIVELMEKAQSELDAFNRATQPLAIRYSAIKSELEFLDAAVKKAYADFAKGTKPLIAAAAKERGEGRGDGGRIEYTCNDISFAALGFFFGGRFDWEADTSTGEIDTWNASSC